MLMAFAFLLSCTSDRNAGYEVQHAGQLRGIMHKNDISAKVAIDSLLERPNLFAVGALDSLSGEIIVEDGVAYISEVENDAVNLSEDKNAYAALLVYTWVKEWQEMPLPDSLSSLQSLENFLLHLSNAKGGDKPFPFRLKGKPESVSYHVIRPLAADATHDERKAAGFSGALTNEELSIVGFYSGKHHGVFTHHDSNIHMHMINEAKSIAGHIDDIKIGNNVQLYIPAE